MERAPSPPPVETYISPLLASNSSPSTPGPSGCVATTFPLAASTTARRLGAEGCELPPPRQPMKTRTHGDVVEPELPDHTQEQTAQYIDGKRAGRKNRTHSILNPAVESVASQRSRCAKYNQEYNPHTFSVSGPIFGLFLCQFGTLLPPATKTS